MTIQTLCLDADDTLWHNETLFHFTHQRFRELLAAYAPAEHLDERLTAAEIRNLKLYGYGVKGFTLSMIETALDVMDADAPTSVIREILDAGRAMLGVPVEPLAGVAEALEILAASYKLVVITKGDLLDQEQKLASSGMGDFFAGVEIVSEKTPEVYTRLFDRYGVAGASAMVGNSLRSDVLPAIAAGGWGVHIPYPLTWALEEAAEPVDRTRYARLDSMAELPAWLAAAG
jgi:putative hydrolase of the HAD superfamily